MDGCIFVFFSREAGGRGVRGGAVACMRGHIVERDALEQSSFEGGSIKPSVSSLHHRRLIRARDRNVLYRTSRPTDGGVCVVEAQ